MQAKIFLSSLLATLFAVGVIATPTGVEARIVGTVSVINNALAKVGSALESSVGTIPLLKGPATTPKNGDVLVASIGVNARDLESLEKRTPGCILITSDPNFAGTSANACGIPNGLCTNLTPLWASNISSFRPDKAATCQVFTGPNCSGIASIIFGYPGYGNLGPFDNNLWSFGCWW